MFLGVFGKLQKATIGFVMSVRMEQFDSHQMDCDEILYLSVFRKFLEKIKVPLKPTKNYGYFTRRRFHIHDDISLNYS
jgi:hypothetical protein